MTNKRFRRNVAALAVLMTAGLALSGGCIPADAVELETFVRDLLLNAAAAFFL